MYVAVEPMSIRELETELRHYEDKFGMPLATFVTAYRSGEAPEVLEEVALEWVMVYEALKLVARDSETR